MVGDGKTSATGDRKAVAEVFPASGNKYLLHGLPRDYLYGSVGYANGRLLYCGGKDLKDPVNHPVSSCFFLAPPLPAWEETWPLLQVKTPRIGC